MNYLDRIRAEIDSMAVKGVVEPGFEVGPSDHIVGEVSDDLKKVLRLIRNEYEEALNLSEQAQTTLIEEQSQILLARAAMAQRKSEFLTELFHLSLQEEFGLWGKLVGIRKGWKVVWSEPLPSEEDDGPPKMVIILGPKRQAVGEPAQTKKDSSQMN